MSGFEMKLFAGQQMPGKCSKRM